jgi:hypothetical protein
MPITAVRCEPIAATVHPDLAIISSLGEHLRGHYVLVRITDDAGRTGLGEASVRLNSSLSGFVGPFCLCSRSGSSSASEPDGPPSPSGRGADRAFAQRSAQLFEPPQGTEDPIHQFGL